jgi:hypothetical protein|tara:strand:- start:1631 stop:1861 length:231 start_codon:yes stop_codon:yes gene_type:complete
MQLGDKKINCLLLKINDNVSLSISDLGRGTNDIKEGLIVCNKTNEFIGDAFHFKSLETLNERLETELTQLKLKELC